MFRGLSIPGLEDTDDNLGAVLGHPCTVRMGAHLKDRIQVARVIPYQRLNQTEWEDGHYGVMPLPGLIPDSDTPHHAIRFEDAGPVLSTALLLDDRVATLSDFGIALLQQRHIMSTSRFQEVDLEALDKANRPVLEELELLDNWNEARCDGLPGDEFVTCLQTQAELFDEFLSATPEEGLRTRRESLQLPTERASVRRAVREEVDG